MTFGHCPGFPSIKSNDLKPASLTASLCFKVMIVLIRSPVNPLHLFQVSVTQAQMALTVLHVTQIAERVNLLYTFLIYQFLPWHLLRVASSPCDTHYCGRLKFYCPLSLLNLEHVPWHHLLHVVHNVEFAPTPRPMTKKNVPCTYVMCLYFFPSMPLSSSLLYQFLFL